MTAVQVGLAVLIGLTGCLVMVGLQRRHIAGVREDRAALFAQVLGVLDRAQVQDRGLDFPILRGRWAGREVRVEPIVDTAGFRVLPILRLVVSMRAERPEAPRMSVLRAETGQEFFAGHRGMHRLRDGAWPADLSVASSSPDPDPTLLAEMVRLMAASPAMKQLLSTEALARCVISAGTADSTTYRVTRRADFAGLRVDEAVLREALTAVDGIVESPLSRVVG